MSSKRLTLPEIVPAHRGGCRLFKCEQLSYTSVTVVALLCLVVTACSSVPVAQSIPPTLTAVPSPTVSQTLTPVATQPPDPTIAPTQTFTSTPVVLALESSFAFQPLAAMLDNHPDARPQSGMSEADVVYEAVVEYGITRFLAIFANNHPEVIGPIRSARHYFVDWAGEYDSIFVFAGASPQGYDEIEQTGITTIDFTYGEGLFWRVTERQAPHNLYTNDPGTRDWHGSEKPGRLGEFSYKPDSPGGNVESIVVTYPDGYRVEYRYDIPSNEYFRFMSDSPHVDLYTGEQYHPKNVIVQFVATRRIPGDDAGRMDMDLNGTGDAVIFQDGIRTEGSWRKTGAKRPTLFTDKTGKRVELNAGQTWIQVVPVDGLLESN